MFDNLNPNLITGIDEIDIQHQDLFDAIKELDSKNKNKADLWNILIQIEIYAGIHFDTEEKYMQKFEYPLIEEHITAHRKFVEDFTKLKKDFNKIGFSEKFVEDFQKFLINWLLNHYTDIDVKMADFIKNRLDSISEQS